MEPRALQYPRPPWGEELRQSSFSPLWEQKSYKAAPLILAPCPDLVRSRCPPPLGSEVNLQAPLHDGTAGESAYDGQEFRRRSYSAASASNPATPNRRRRRDSYVPQQPPTPPGDGGPDWLPTTTTAESSPEAAASCVSRSRSIVLRKSKRRPAPPQRSVSLRRGDGHAHSRGSKTRSLYLPGDAAPPPPGDLTKPRPPSSSHAATRSFLPDLVLISKPRAEEEEEEEEEGEEEPGRSPSANPAADLSIGGGCPGQQCGEVTRPESGRRPPPGPPPRGRLPQSPPSPDAPAPPLLLTPAAARTRPQPRPSPDSPRGRTSRLRLSLELPLSTSTAPTPPAPAPTPDPPTLRPKAARRHSDSSAFSHPLGRRLSAGVAAMPVVTQEELSNVRLRPLLQSDQSHDDVDEGPERREACCPLKPPPPPPPPPQGPKARPPPPVAAKPPVPRWLPGHMTETETPPPAPQNPPTGRGQGQGEVTYTKVLRPKPKRSHHHHHAATSDDITQQRPANRPPGHAIDAPANPAPYSQSETRGGVGNCPVTVAERVPAELQRKRVTPPPVARKPDIILRPSTNNHLTNTNTGQCLEDRGGQGSAASQMTRLSLGETDLSPPRTEDLFTIIHRSKKKLLSGRESVDSPGSRQAFGSPTRGGCDPPAPAQGQGQGVGGERSSSKTDSFMAFLQRRRSQKPNAGERVSAAELLKTSKHLTNHSTEPA